MKSSPSPPPSLAPAEPSAAAPAASSVAASSSSAQSAAGATTTAATATAAKRYRAAPAKTFQCRGFGECRMVFSRSEHLARHVRKHTGERPFTCHCGKQFSRLDNLRQHAQTVHADKPDVNDQMMRDLSTLHTALAANSGKTYGREPRRVGDKRKADDIEVAPSKVQAPPPSHPVVPPRPVTSAGYDAGFNYRNPNDSAGQPFLGSFRASNNTTLSSSTSAPGQSFRDQRSVPSATTTSPPIASALPASASAPSAVSASATARPSTASSPGPAGHPRESKSPPTPRALKPFPRALPPLSSIVSPPGSSSSFSVPSQPHVGGSSSHGPPSLLSSLRDHEFAFSVPQHPPPSRGGYGATSSYYAGDSFSGAPSAPRPGTAPASYLSQRPYSSSSSYAYGRGPSGLGGYGYERERERERGNGHYGQHAGYGHSSLRLSPHNEYDERSRPSSSHFRYSHTDADNDVHMGSADDAPDHHHYNHNYHNQRPASPPTFAHGPHTNDSPFSFHPPDEGSGSFGGPVRNSYSSHGVRSGTAGSLSLGQRGESRGGYGGSGTAGVKRPYTSIDSGDGHNTGYPDRHPYPNTNGFSNTRERPRTSAGPDDDDEGSRPPSRRLTVMDLCGPSATAADERPSSSAGPTGGYRLFSLSRSRPGTSSGLTSSGSLGANYATSDHAAGSYSGVGSGGVSNEFGRHVSSAQSGASTPTPAARTPTPGSRLDARSTTPTSPATSTTRGYGAASVPFSSSRGGDERESEYAERARREWEEQQRQQQQQSGKHYHLTSSSSSSYSPHASHPQEGSPTSSYRYERQHGQHGHPQSRSEHHQHQHRYEHRAQVLPPSPLSRPSTGDDGSSTSSNNTSSTSPSTGVSPRLGGGIGIGIGIGIRGGDEAELPITRRIADIFSGNGRRNSDDGVGRKSEEPAGGVHEARIPISPPPTASIVRDGADRI